MSRSEIIAKKAKHKNVPYWAPVARIKLFEFYIGWSIDQDTHQIMKRFNEGDEDNY